MTQNNYKLLLVASLAALLVSCHSSDTEVESGTNTATAAQLSSPRDSLAVASQNIIMHPEYARSLARMAYIWGYPMVNMMNRKATLAKAPSPGRLGGVLPAAPTGYVSMLNDYIDPAQTFIACPNQDVVYGLGFFSLDEQPVIMQVPDFGDRFWVYSIYDARTDQVGQLGKPYGSKAGFYLLKGPNWKGKVPEGIAGVLTSPTTIGNCIPRIFMDDTKEDRAAMQPLVNQVMVYPLTEFDGKMKTNDWAKAPSFPKPPGGGSGETKWVIPEKYFDEFGEVLASIPPLPGEESMYGQFRSLMAAAAKSPAIKKVITDEVIALDKTLIKDFMQWKYNGKPAGSNWNRSQNNAEWGLDYYNRTGTCKSNMFDNRPGETQYFYTDHTTDSLKLNGKSNYRITFTELPPVKGFWSLTMYTKEHFFYPNPLKRYSLGTKNKGLQKNANGTVTLYAGNKNPGAEKESNWLPAPPEDFSLYLRAYWGDDGIVNGTWIPPVIEKY